MVDVSGKERTMRVAEAEGIIIMERETLERIRSGDTPKGNPLQVAQLAGIMAAKRTADLIPLCHPLPGASVDVTVDAEEALPGIRVRAEARFAGQTGVEMEALTAVSVALLTIYDMVKAVDRGMRIEGVRLIRKEGGSRGTWRADEDPLG